MLIKLNNRSYSIECIPSEEGFGIQFIGLHTKYPEETKLRVISAIKHSGFKMPQQNLIINISPAYDGTNQNLLDLPIALSIITSGINTKNIAAPLGELSLFGEVMNSNNTLSSEFLKFCEEKTKKVHRNFLVSEAQNVQ